MPYFGTLSRISTKLVCATHSCALPMALSLKLFMEKERLFGSRKTFLPYTEMKKRWFLLRILSINAGKKSAHYQSRNAARLVCLRYRYGVGIFVNFTHLYVKNARIL
jgi:hypothetical protein